ncbi:MAG TPA: hypothetical protein DEQ40_19070 [Oxalobacteraceae bacterium]|jgi:hypothetical protein|nr:hypothetical protein [Oxalobacteraceae bacterium]
MLKFHRRVVVYAAQSERIVLWATPRQAATLLHCGQATLHTKERKTVRTIQLTGRLVDIRQLGIRPGSYGIHREETAYGIVFAHKRCYPELAR